MKHIALSVLAAEENHPNPLLPHPPDIIWSLVATVVVFFVLWKFAIPAFTRVMNERTEKIEGGLARAEQAQREAAQTLSDYRKQLDDARTEAAQIRDDARAQGQQIIADMKQQATHESDRIIAAGHASLEAQRQQIIAELRRDLGRNSINLAERIVGHSLSAESKQSETIDRFMTELDTKS